jgi:flagellar hook-basal body protein
MENTLLVGLSRLVTLERHVDVIANNVANVNTNGFKADRSLFEEYLRSPAHEDNFQRSDRRVSFVQDRVSFHDFAAGNTELTKNPLDVSIDGRGFLAVQTPPASATPATAASRSTISDSLSPPAAIL